MVGLNTLTMAAEENNMEYEGYKIKSDGVYSIFKINGVGSGDIPQSLKGSFTSPKEAMKAIDLLEGKGKRKDVKAKVAS